MQSHWCPLINVHGIMYAVSLQSLYSFMFIHTSQKCTLGMPIYKLAEGPSTLSVRPRRAKKDDNKLKSIVISNISIHLYSYSTYYTSVYISIHNICEW